MQIQVLTTGFWPSSPSCDTIIIPSELLSLMDNFVGFYSDKYQGRRLSWAHYLERCVVTARFLKGKKDLEVSLFQVYNYYKINYDYWVPKQIKFNLFGNLRRRHPFIILLLL